METDPQEFEKLRRLLALKRDEVPPPGYFENFSDKVIARIEAEAAEPSAWQQFLSMFRTNPAISWSLGVAAVALIFVVAQPSNDGANVDTANPNVANGSAAAASMAMTTNQSIGDRSRAAIVHSPVYFIQPTNSNAEKPSLFATPFYEQAAPVPASYSP